MNKENYFVVDLIKGDIIEFKTEKEARDIISLLLAEHGVEYYQGLRVIQGNELLIIR